MANMKLTLRVWRQDAPNVAGMFKEYKLEDVNSDMSFLEMLDILNEQITVDGGIPITFDYDCREGICGACGLVIDGIPHGPLPGTTTCQLFMRHFKDGATITIEPWRASAFPVIRDLTVDRSAMDRVMQAGGYTSMNCGNAPEANALPVGKDVADKAMDAATCIGCGACVAACKNASISLFTGAKIAQLGLLPQGQPERSRRAVSMVERMDSEGFGSCTNEAECEAACPKEISTRWIHMMNREYMRGVFLLSMED